MDPFLTKVTGPAARPAAVHRQGAAAADSASRTAREQNAPHLPPRTCPARWQIRQRTHHGYPGAPASLLLP